VGIGGNGKLTHVVVAAADLEPGHALSEQDLKVATLPADALPRGHAASPADFAGRVVTSQVVAGQTVVESMLAAKGATAGAPALIPLGHRAVSLDVSEATSVGGLLVPGCHVDIVSTM